MKKIIIFLLTGLLIISLIGCGNKKETKQTSQKQIESQKQAVEGQNKLEPKPDPMNEEQKKNPLPEGAKQYTGQVKKVDGDKVVISVQDIDLEFTIDKGTNLQKGNNPGTGKIEDLKPELKVNVLVQNSHALLVHYE